MATEFCPFRGHVLEKFDKARFREMPCEKDTLRSQLVDVWGSYLVYPIAAQLGSQVINGNEKHIGAIGTVNFTCGTLEKPQRKEDPQYRYNS